MPDFDVDFDERRRGEVIRMSAISTATTVAQIVTYAIKAKQAVKDAHVCSAIPLRTSHHKVMPWGDGKGRSARRIFTPPMSGTAKAASSARSTTQMTSNASSIPRPDQGLAGCHARWRHHVE